MRINRRQQNKPTVADIGWSKRKGKVGRWWYAYTLLGPVRTNMKNVFTHNSTDFKDDKTAMQRHNNVNISKVMW